MARKYMFKGKSADDSLSAAPSVERVGIFMRPWKLVKSYGMNTMNVCVQSFSAGQLIFDDELIKSYKSQGAPLRVYIYDVESDACGTD